MDINKQWIKQGLPLLLCLLTWACSEDKLPLFDTADSSLNIAKGSVFGDINDYPEKHIFNAYFLGAGIHEYKIQIPVRVCGIIDYDNDRPYEIQANPDSTIHALDGTHYSFEKNQIFRKGHYQDTIEVTIHIDALSDTDNYKLCLELLPNQYFQQGVEQYQSIMIDFNKNLSTPPTFWTETYKLSKLTYHPRKCAVFLQFSGITDPNWEDNNATILLDYWIRQSTQWFLDHEEYDESGNRIYFDE